METVAEYGSLAQMRQVRCSTDALTVEALRRGLQMRADIAEGQSRINVCIIIHGSKKQGPAVCFCVKRAASRCVQQHDCQYQLHIVYRKQQSKHVAVSATMSKRN
jgi:hypothetical protein